MVSMLLFALPFVYVAAVMSLNKVNITSPIPATLESQTWDQGKTKLIVSAFINYEGASGGYGPLCSESMRFALSMLESSSLPIFRRYQLGINLYDDQCSRPVGIPLTIKTVMGSKSRSNVLPIALTSSCFVSTYTGKMFHHLNYSGFAPAALIPDVFVDRKIYDSFYPIFNLNDKAYAVLAEFFVINGWQRVALLSETMAAYDSRERLFASELEQRNITMLMMAKYDMNSLPEEMSLTASLGELRFSGARVIVIHSSAPSFIACYLHRMKFTGPRYVFFFSVTVPLQPLTSPLYPWCSRTMLWEVLGVSFFFGMPMTFEAGYKPDTLGVTGYELLRNMKDRIENPENNVNWPLAATLCYTQVLTIGFLMQSLEDILTMRNETLADWTTNKRFFTENGGLMMHLVKQAIRNVHFTTPLREIDFNKNGVFSTTNDLIPSMLQYANQTSSKLQMIYHYQESNGNLVAGPMTTIWRTGNGLPPADGVRSVYVMVQPFPQSLAIAVMSISAAIIAVVIIVILSTILTLTKLLAMGNAPSLLRIPLLLGDLLSLLFNFGLLAVQDTQMRCNVKLCLALSGLSLAGLSLAARLEMALYMLIKRRTSSSFKPPSSSKKTTSLAINSAHAKFLSSPNKRGYSKRSRNLSKERVDAMRKLRNLKAACLLLSVIAFFAVYTAATWIVVLAFEPTILVPVNVAYEANDNGTEIHFVSQKCDYFALRSDVGYQNETAKAAAIVWLAIHLLVMLRGFFLAFYLRNKRLSMFPGLTKVTIMAYVTFVMIFSGGIIVFILSRVDSILFAACADFAIACTTICCAISHLGVTVHEISRSRINLLTGAIRNFLRLSRP